MALPATGFLTKGGTFYHTEDEADYHDLVLDVTNSFKDVCDAFEVPTESQEKLSSFFFTFIKQNDKTIIALLECYRRINPSDDAARQDDEGGEGVREPIRVRDIDRVESLADAEDTSEQSQEEDGDTDEVQLRRSGPLKAADRKARKEALSDPATDVVELEAITMNPVTGEYEPLGEKK